MGKTGQRWRLRAAMALVTGLLGGPCLRPATAEPVKLGVLTFLTDMHTLGLDTMQGLPFVVPFSWDMDEQTRAFSRRFEQRLGKTPSEAQSGVYSGVLHDLEAVQSVGSKDTAAVLARMQDTPVEDAFSRHGRLLPNGRAIHDMVLVRVKSPCESHHPWDDDSIRTVIPPETAFRPLSESACPLVKTKHEDQRLRMPTHRAVDRSHPTSG